MYLFCFLARHPSIPHRDMPAKAKGLGSVFAVSVSDTMKSECLCCVTSNNDSYSDSTWQKRQLECVGREYK